MVVGLLAITLMVFTVRGLATSFRPPVLVLLGLAAWTAVAVGLMHLTR
jgi:hypothetical protein